MSIFLTGNSGRTFGRLEFYLFFLAWIVFGYEFVQRFHTEVGIRFQTAVKVPVHVKQDSSVRSVVIIAVALPYWIATCLVELACDYAYLIRPLANVPVVFVAILEHAIVALRIVHVAIIFLV